MHTSKKTAAALLLLVVVVLGATYIGWRFDADIAAASDRAAAGSKTAQTRCGPIEYQERGQGAPLLMVHGSGGGHDQGMLFAKTFAKHGIRVIAMSSFGYLRTPMPVDASPSAQADAHVCLMDSLGIARASVLGASAVLASTSPDKIAIES